jgi:hypothetical protein
MSNVCRVKNNIWLIYGGRLNFNNGEVVYSK